jgi:hypothetical protein
MVTEKTWDEFRASGLLCLLNFFLHIFGWAIVIEGDIVNGDVEKVLRVYPARVKFRGFDEKSQTEAFLKISKFMNENSTDLLKEASE